MHFKPSGQDGEWNVKALGHVGFYATKPQGRELEDMGLSRG